MHTLRFKLRNPVIAGINTGGRLRHQVSFDGLLSEGTLRARTELSRFTIDLYPPSPDGVTPPDCIRVETMLSDEAFIELTLDQVFIERLMYAHAEDDIALIVHFKPGGAPDDQGNPAFESVSHPSAIDWYTDRAVGVPIVLASVIHRPGHRGN